jgi:hypothetical protein
MQPRLIGIGGGDIDVPAEEGAHARGLGQIARQIHMAHLALGLAAQMRGER